MTNRPLSLFIFFVCAFCATGVRASGEPIAPTTSKNPELAEKCKILYDYQLKLIKRNFDLAKKFITFDQNADGIKMPCHDIHEFLTNNGSYKPAVKTKKNIFKYTRYIAAFCAATSAFLLAYCKPKQSPSFLCCGGLLTSLAFFFASTCKLNHYRNIKRQAACEHAASALMGFGMVDARCWSGLKLSVYDILSQDDNKSLWQILPDAKQLRTETLTLPNNVPIYISDHPKHSLTDDSLQGLKADKLPRISMFKLARIYNENTNEEEKLEPEKNKLIIEAQKYETNISNSQNEAWKHTKLYPNKKPFIRPC